MRKIVIIVFLAFLVANCSGNDDDAFMNNASDIKDEPVEMTSLVMGDFVSGAHPTSGKAAVNKDKTILSFTNFKTDNGPKLLVYLSTDVSSTEFVNLGDLKGIEGNFTYNIPANIDLSKYKLVNIWCVDFSVSFGTAELK
jgi:hypothetical protein